MASYFITGATGTIGHHLVNTLTADGYVVTAASRHPERAREYFGNRVTTAAFDFADPTTFDLALKADGVFLLGPPLYPELFSLLSPFVDYLEERSYRGRVVYLSAYGMEDLPELPFHQRMEEKLRNADLDCNVLRPGFFSQNFGNYERENIEQRGIVFSPAGKGRTAFISAPDTARCAAVLLTDPDRHGEVHEVTGPEAFSYFEVADMLSEVIGKHIVYPNPDEPTYREVLRQGGAPDFVADYMLPIYGLIKDSRVAAVTEGVYGLTGHQPEPLRLVLEQDFAVPR